MYSIFSMVLMATILTSVHSIALAADEGIPLSTITLPVSINLNTVEARINAEVPSRLETISMKGHMCKEAEWLKTKSIPKCSMKGIKIYCKDRWLKTKITPEIKCDVDGWVERNGPISLSGSNNSLTISVPVKAKVTARGRGDIGKNIQQSVHAATVITAVVTPSISPDWEPSLDINTDFSWTERPNFKLFNLIKVSVGSQIEPKLREVLDDIEKSIPNLLADANLKTKASKAWREIQNPVTLSEQDKITAIFEPVAVGLGNIQTSNKITRVSFNIAGIPRVYVGADAPVMARKSLPNLSDVPTNQSSIELTLPITAHFDSIAKTGNEKLAQIGDIELDKFGQQGLLQISDVELASTGEVLSVSAEFALDNNAGLLNALDIFGWFDVKGRVVFNVVPVVDKNLNIVSLSTLKIDTDTNSLVADGLLAIARLKPVQELLRKSVHYNYSEELAMIRLTASKEMARDLSDEVRLLGTINSLAVGNMEVGKNALTIPVDLKGTAEVFVGI
jgi:hypothetical protein